MVHAKDKHGGYHLPEKSNPQQSIDNILSQELTRKDFLQQSLFFSRKISLVRLKNLGTSPLIVS